jgi:2-amino-4-hydroxy-6-hydroxymethyldihydropteridine diphosphokinase
MNRQISILSFGSNEGPREEHLLMAVDRLADEDDLRIVALSSLFETEPVGAATRAPFVNAVCIVDTLKTPRDLLETCLELERHAGRHHRTVDRPLDVDIVLFGELVVEEEDLVIPHPRFRERLFVLVPLGEIAPSLALPPDGRAAVDIIAASRLPGWVRRISSRGML